jgi:DNA-binding beta-propeller fold protein YncE
MARTSIIRGRNIMKGKAGKKGVLGMTVCVCLLSLFLPLAAAAVSIPSEVEQLTGITMDKEVLWSPGRLAVAGDGTLYVADSYKNHIVKFDRDGNYLGDIAFPRVSAIAVAPNGTLYIGSHQDYSVSIVRNGKVVGQLGDGRDEFRSIRDIACDASTGLVYVADNVGNAVRIFDSAGRDLGSIGGVNLPISVEATPEAIIVIDAPVVKADGGKTTASRISIFNKAHKLTDTIDDYGKDQIFRPTDIAAAGGILYITDAALQSVVLYDAAGTCLGEIQSTAGPLRTAVSVAMSPDGILYVSSNETHSVHMFAISPGASVRQGGQQ